MSVLLQAKYITDTALHHSTVNSITDISLAHVVNTEFVIRLIINLISGAILIGGIHYRLYKKKEYVFTYFMMNTIIFFIAYSLQSSGLSMGASFGLFAVFSMMRYRTEDITQKDMTYLFIVIALGVITGVTKGSWIEMSLYNGLVIGITLLLEGNFIMRRELTQNIQFENVELIKPDKREELIAELKKRTGLNIHRVTISRLDYLRDSAVVKIFYYEV